MTAELALIAKATVILGIALAATRLAHRGRASVRALILASAFGLLLVMPVVSAITPPREVRIPAAIAPTFFIDDPTPQQNEVFAAPPSTTPRPSSTWQLPSVRALARSAWLLGTVATLLPLAVGLWRVRAIRRRGRKWAEATAWGDELRPVLGRRRAVTVVLHEDVSTPVTCGWLRPTIVMPLDAPDWSAGEIRQALLHELEHVRRHDWPVHVVARLTCALYWFHPAAWTAWRQLSLESERACDDAVVGQAEKTAYAQQLVTLARRITPHRANPLLSMADRRTLATRVSSILNPGIERGRVGTLAIAVTAAVALAVSVVLFPLQARAQVPSAFGLNATVDPAMRFGVASVRPNDGSDPSRGFGFTLESGRLRLRNQTLRTMISVAYAPTFGLWFPDERISGGPAWMNSERFTIEARAERAVTGREMGAMLRTLLAERFGLKVRIETRSAPIYALVLARREGTLGPMLKPTATECTGRCGIGGGRGRNQLSGASMALFAGSLAELVGRPVVDRTGLTGTFDGTLEWVPMREELGALGEPAPGVPEFGISLFTALEEQFGLKLQSERGGVDYLVIESADRPTPNDAPELPSPAAQTTRHAFEVASVRSNQSGSEVSRGPIIQPGNRFLAQNVMARVLITTAYGLRWEQVVGGPAWLDSEHWDVEARAGEAAQVDDVRAMLRTLLAGRFGLVARRETRQQDIYALTRSGTTRATPGLRAAAIPCTAVRPPGRLPLAAPGTPGPEGEPPVSLGSPSTCERFTFPGYIGARQIRMPEFATLLTMFAGRSVHDRTGMSGEYDIDLTFAPNPAAAADDFAPLPTAVQGQLGLRLEATRGPVEVLVIERIERPTDN